MRGVVWAVIRREYLQRVRSKWFVFATVAGPLFMLALIFIPAFIAVRGEQSDRELAVIDRTGVLYERLAPRLEQVGYSVERASGDDQGMLATRVAEGELGGLLVLDEATLAMGRAALTTTSAPSAVRSMSVRSAIVQSALEERLQAETYEVRVLLSGGELDIDVVSSDGSSMDSPQFVAAYIGAFLLYMVILLYAVAIMRSVLQEKTNRVVEVIISSMRPFHLMLGKILGVGAVGLTQLAIWVGSAALIIGLGVPAVLAARPELAQFSQVREFLPGAGYAVLFLVFFLGGFFIYAGLYAAVGAMCSTDEEAQQAQFPVMLIIVVPILFVTQVIQDPNSALSVGLSLVPFFSPILMFARAVGGATPMWQVGLSIVLMAMTVVAVAWVAGRIYKVGVLMAGKRPTLPELIRWVREA